MYKLNALITLFIVLVCFLVLSAQEAEVQPFKSPESIDVYNFDSDDITNQSFRTYQYKATEFYSSGDYESAAKYYLTYLQFKPEDANSWYNLSCCYGLLGKADLASKYLMIAYKRGFRDLEHIQQDTDLDKVRESIHYTAAMDSINIWAARRDMYLGDMEYIALQQYQPYWVHPPKNYDPAKKYTLVIGLHGYGDMAPNFSMLWRYMMDQDIVYVVAEAPYGFIDGESAGYSWTPFLSRESSTYKTAMQQVDKYILAIQKQVKQQFSIDQTWLFGFSQGAYLSYNLALSNPKAFTGIVACGGGLMPELYKPRDFKAARKLKVIISHGIADKVIDFAQGKSAYEYLKEKGFAVYLHEFEGTHLVSKDVFPILFEQIREKQIR